MANFDHLYSKVKGWYDEWLWVPPTILLCYYPNIYLDDVVRRSWLPRAEQTSPADLSLLLQALLIIGPLLSFLLFKYSILDVSELPLRNATRDKNGQACNCAYDTSNCPLHSEQLQLPDTDIQTGLDREAISARRTRYGRHEAWKGIKWPLWALKFCSSPALTFILAGAALAVSLREWLHVGLICLLWLLMVNIPFHQQKNAEEIAAMLTTSPFPAIVLRDGDLQEVSTTELVPSDIVHVSDGATIPADGIVITSNDLLEVDQSYITGKTLPVQMIHGDMCHYQTSVAHGEAFLQVKNTGWNTFTSSTIRSVQGKDGGSETHVRKELVSTKDFTIVMQALGAIMLLVSALPALLWQTSVSGVESWPKIFCLVAEMGMIATRYLSTSSLTSIKATSSSELSQEGCLAQDIEAIETLAGIDTLCVDDTGIITENRYTLLRPHCVSCDVEDLILAVSMRDAVAFDGRGVDRATATALKQFPQAKARRDRSKLIDHQESEPYTDRAFTQCLVEASDGARYFYASGSPTAVIELCQNTPTDLAEHERFREAVRTFIDRGLYTIGVAQRSEGQEWKLLGALPFLDPPRATTKAAIKQAEELEVDIKIMSDLSPALTGKTARAIGLDPSVVDADMFDKLQKDQGGQLAMLIDRANVYAGLNIKARGDVLTILQNKGHRVAITGYGAPQVPLLRKAECGIAPPGATSTAMSGADLVFVEKSSARGLPPFISAIRFSRQVLQHSHNYVVWQTVRTLHVLLTMLLAFVAEKRLLDMRLLLINSVAVEFLLLLQSSRPEVIKTPYPRRPTRWSRARALREIASLVVVMLCGPGVCIYALSSRDKSPALSLLLALGDIPVHLLMHTDGRVWLFRQNWKVSSARVAIHLLTTMLCVTGWAGATFHISIEAAVKVWTYGIMTFMAAGTVQYALCKAAHLELPPRK